MWIPTRDSDSSCLKGPHVITLPAAIIEHSSIRSQQAVPCKRRRRGGDDDADLRLADLRLSFLARVTTAFAAGSSVFTSPAAVFWSLGFFSAGASTAAATGGGGCSTMEPVPR
jgi:hypothetical protein